MKKSSIVLCCAILAAGISAAMIKNAAAAPKSSDDSSPLMKEKLAHAQKALSGLVYEDFDEIKKSGGELIRISEEAQWTKFKSPRFNQLSQEFRWNVEKMNQMAGDKNLEGTTLAYTQVTMSCVECHKLVRGKEKVVQAK